MAILLVLATNLQRGSRWKNIHIFFFVGVGVSRLRSQHQTILWFSNSLKNLPSNTYCESIHLYMYIHMYVLVYVYEFFKGQTSVTKNKFPTFIKIQFLKFIILFLFLSVFDVGFILKGLDYSILKPNLIKTETSLSPMRVNKWNHHHHLLPKQANEILWNNNTE